jgi:hypothetical protein
MTPEAFNRIEQAFGVTLPDWYRRQIVEYPFVEPDDALYPDEESIVRANQELRRDGWFRFPWPREFFIIGDDGCGGYYFIVPSAGNKRIFIADHEGGPAPSFDKLDKMVQSETIEKYISETLGFIRECEKMDERRRNKKWWQFWI